MSGTKDMLGIHVVVATYILNPLWRRIRDRSLIMGQGRGRGVGKFNPYKKGGGTTFSLREGGATKWENRGSATLCAPR